MAMRPEALSLPLLLLACLHLGTPGRARADSYVAGNRAFVPTILTDDPFVADEISTTATRLDYSASRADPAYRESDAGWEFAKRITPDLGVGLEQGYTVIEPARGKRLRGFDNLEAVLKYQLYVNPEHEFLFSIGITREFGGTGTGGIADDVSVTEPAIFFGKGMGDLPDTLAPLRPFAVTGRIGYQIPDDFGVATPRMLNTSMAVEYSLRYLEGNVRYLGLPEFIDRMTPIVEIDYTIPMNHSAGVATMGYIAPGLVYTGDSFDVGAEALIPTTGAAGTGVGVMTMLHFRLGPLFPSTLGRPLWADMTR